MVQYDTHAETLSGDGSTGTAQVGPEGRAFMAGSDTFGGGTLSLELSLDGGTTWLDSGLDLTAAGYVVDTDLPTGALIRGTLASSTTPSLDVVLKTG